MIALLDCNNFYVSCERLFKTSLNDKPVAVLSNNDGCIISRSEEVKSMGIKMGEPFFKVKKKLNDAGVHVCSSNYSLYGDISNRVMEIIRKDCDILEKYSIDEAFFDLSNIKNKELFCFNLKNKILKWTGIPVSIGIGKTKTLSKIANRVVKKNNEYKIRLNFNGIYEINCEDELNYILRNTSVEDIWGIGRRLSVFFRKININDAFSFKNINLKFIRQKKGIVTQKTVLELRGVECYPIELEQADRKSICVSRSFGEKIYLYEELQSALIIYSEKASQKLRKYRLSCGAITVFIQTSRYDEKYYFDSKTFTFIEQTLDSRLIWIKANYLLKKLYVKGFRYSKVGIILSKLCRHEKVQISLLNYALNNENSYDDKESKVLMKTIDSLNERFGEGKVRIASGANSFSYKKKLNTLKKKNNWLMRSNYCSPCYTTRWCDIPKVKIK